MKNNLDLTTIKALVIDMDGVLWRGNTFLPGYEAFFEFIQDRAMPFVLATNNASKTPQQYIDRLAKGGITVQRHHVMSSALATAAYLEKQLSPGAKLYVIGEDGLREAVDEAGFIRVKDASEPAEAVVVGLDTQLSYDKLKQATLLIRRGAKFVATNGDLTFPVENGFVPGTGSILAALKASTEVDPTVIGKPAAFMFDVSVEKMGCDHQQTVMLGDRLETDILGAKNAGIKTILVTSGVDNQDSVRQKGIEPDAIFSGIEELVTAWQKL